MTWSAALCHVVCFCVKNSGCTQQAKPVPEAALQEQSDMTWSIIRPLISSLSMQLELVKGGRPYNAFEDRESHAMYPHCRNPSLQSI
jgi:hypothetical protein